MDDAFDASTNEVAELRKENEQLKQVIAELTAKVEWYEEQFRPAQQRRFGASSERTDPDQPRLCSEAEATAEATAAPLLPEPTVDKITHERRRQKGRREAMLADLPVETVEYRLSEEEQVCPQCGGPMHEMRVETREELRVIPAQVKLVRHERQVYACRNCQRNEERTPIVTAPRPNPVIKNSLASPSAVAYIMDQKYTCGLPLYRQEQQLARIGVKLSRQTTASWSAAARANPSGEAYRIGGVADGNLPIELASHSPRGRRRPFKYPPLSWGFSSCGFHVAARLAEVAANLCPVG
ncbi:MAG: IS66 family transposase zinc-finger binding domain-containing protein [Firmicutes bacterium]|jgi:transposase|nr:IS66 family transposase zinc-finger binding domain-containing protein [Bacillota bacterium]